MIVKRCPYCMNEMGDEDTVCPTCGTDLSTFRQRTGALPVNTILDGQYMIGRLLGQGGFGMTYLGYDLKFDLKVAVKEFFPSALANRQNGCEIEWCDTEECENPLKMGQNDFLKEARKMAKIDNIPVAVRVRNVFYENNTAYIVMDYVEGKTLKDYLKETGPLSPQKAMELLKPVMEALEQFHGMGIIHRDISPDNIMLEVNGNIRLLDMGAAKDLKIGKSSSISSHLVTKRGFSPPEQYTERGRIGSWTDVYAMCATFFYTVSGRCVPDAIDRMQDDEEMAERMAQAAIPDDVKQILQNGLQVTIEERIGKMKDLEERLDKACKEPEEEPKKGFFQWLFGRFRKDPKPVIPEEKIQVSSVAEEKKQNTVHINKELVIVKNPEAPIVVSSEISEEETPTEVTDTDATILEKDVFVENVPYLILENSGEKYNITKCRFVIGRVGKGKKDQTGQVAPAADLCIYDPEKRISRHHAAILFNGENYYLENLSSKNPTSLNGKSLEVHSSSQNDNSYYGYLLNDGDRIKLCHEALIFCSADGEKQE